MALLEAVELVTVDEAGKPAKPPPPPFAQAEALSRMARVVGALARAGMLIDADLMQAEACCADAEAVQLLNHDGDDGKDDRGWIEIGIGQQGASAFAFVADVLATETLFSKYCGDYWQLACLASVLGHAMLDKTAVVEDRMAAGEIARRIRMLHNSIADGRAISIERTRAKHELMQLATWIRLAVDSSAPKQAGILDQLASRPGSNR
nr:hypothetical protein HK105_007014 [Polyrhizophydium stewartii]